MYDSRPISIITDQDLAIGKAIGKVFPNTRHRFCAWHIRKHVLEHLQPLHTRYDDFKHTYNIWVKSQNIEDFEAMCDDLRKKYHIEDNTWLGNMYKLRRYWVKAYLKDVFFAGMTTSGRSESIHYFFDGFVNSKTMLNEFVLQYDKVVCSRRSAEEDQDFRTLNSKPTPDSGHPIEEMAAQCYTRSIYDIFRKEWKSSGDCGHEKISKTDDLVKYRVGYLKCDKQYWKIVEYKVTSDFFATCSCARFETSGILCKHILYVMKRKQLTSIPDHYIVSRWTMKATYNVGSIGTRVRGHNDEGSHEVSFMTLWSTRAKFNKALEEGRDSPGEIEKLNALIDVFIEEQNIRKTTRTNMNPDISCTTPTVTQQESNHIYVSDPKNPVKTKGRPKVAIRIKSGIEMSMDSKKRKMCGYCKGKGHNITGCQKRKMDKAKADSTNEVTFHFNDT